MCNTFKKKENTTNEIKKIRDPAHLSSTDGRDINLRFIKNGVVLMKFSKCLKSIAYSSNILRTPNILICM